ncbi:hypothetical protein H310_06377 [Aphanomyces invadans]|uniref:HSF-type DNA-binding domain-containing protein n=1 Tax=Aphanomyces invadans TaxID=157072 RepID=A0A024U696_9STRA|nr:hypothetical protein H310_06377 [Aphanomyces invadans]ETW01799.1 hypothetical protein H310_06377 [Aphanomyces invadans]|eukprot:XP_008869647.1 hypothetical protein H310_06377 [Aphanomyces invadans]
MLALSAPSHPPMRHTYTHDTSNVVESPCRLHNFSVEMNLSIAASKGFAIPMQMEACKRGWVAPFLLHLHQMLRRESPQIIRWTPNGKAFEILDKTTMTEKILPKYFRNKNFASFQRQLNYFGFRKWSKSRAMHSTYSRDHFTRDNFDELVYVKRQSKRKSGGTESSDKSDIDMEEASNSTELNSLMSSPIKTQPAVSSNLRISSLLSPDIDTAPTNPAQSLVDLQQGCGAKETHSPSALPCVNAPRFSLPSLSEFRQNSPQVGMRLPSLHQIVPSIQGFWPVEGQIEDGLCSPSSSSNSTQTPSRIEYNVKELEGLNAARFIRGLYDMISSKEGDCIRWNDDGRSFIVINSSRLAWKSLPKYFKHNKFRSFQQQLNMYGFHKESKGRAEPCTYSHPLFRRGCFADLCRIARKTSLS